MRIKQIKIKFFSFSVLLLFLLFVIFKKTIILKIIKSSIEENGGEINIVDLSTPLFSNSYTFKGEIYAINSDIKLNKISRDYILFGFLKASKSFKYINIEGGEIKFKDVGQERFPGNLPSFNLVTIKNFDVVLPNSSASSIKFTIEDLELHDLSQENIVPKFTFIRLQLTYGSSKVQIDSNDGKIVRMVSKKFDIEDLRQFLPSYTSIIESATFSFAGESMYPELQKDGHVQIQIQINDFKLKDKNQVGYIETLYYSKLLNKLETVKRNGVFIQLIIDKQNHNKSPTVILQENQSKLINEIFTQILKL